MKKSKANIIYDVFERTEKKYVISAQQFRAFLDGAADKLVADQFADSHVSSLYYDNDSFDMINRSIEKPDYKEKLRVRAYDTPSAGDAVYVELKKKFDGIVYKRRMAMTMQGARAYMAGMPYEQAMRTWPLSDPARMEEAFAPHTMQIVHELDASLTRHPGIQPAVMVIVHRWSMRTNDGSNIRMTFDIDSRYRTDDLLFEQGLDGNLLFDDGQVILEIKCGDAYPLWLARLLSSLRMYPQGGSKVGMAYAASHPTQLPALAVALAALGAAPLRAAAQGEDAHVGGRADGGLAGGMSSSTTANPHPAKVGLGAAFAQSVAARSFDLNAVFSPAA